MNLVHFLHWRLFHINPKLFVLTNIDPVQNATNVQKIVLRRYSLF